MRLNLNFGDHFDAMHWRRETTDCLGYQYVLVNRIDESFMRDNVARNKVKQRELILFYCAIVNFKLEYFLDEASEGALTRAPLGYFYNAPHWGGYFEPPSDFRNYWTD